MCNVIIVAWSEPPRDRRRAWNATQHRSEPDLWVFELFKEWNAIIKCTGILKDKCARGVSYDWTHSVKYMLSVVTLKVCAIW